MPIVPIFLTQEKEQPQVCRHCGEKNPIAGRPSDPLATCVVIFLFLMAVALFCLFVSWMVDRTYGEHLGQHFVPYLIDAFKALWKMLKELW